MTDLYHIFPIWTLCNQQGEQELWYTYIYITGISPWMIMPYCTYVFHYTATVVHYINLE